MFIKNSYKYFLFQHFLSIVNIPCGTSRIVLLYFRINNYRMTQNFCLIYYYVP
jgi:hypothetical protein